MSTARYISPEERASLLLELSNPRDRLIVALGVNTGLRVSELLSLRWRQLIQRGEPASVLEVPRRFLKGGRALTRKRVSSRRVVLNAAAASAVKEFAFARFGSGPVKDNEPVFKSRKRFPGMLGRKQAHTIIRAAAERAGLASGVAPHSRRRAFAGDVYAATGHDLVATQLLMGHASPLTTAQYLKPRQDELDQIVRELPTTSTASAEINRTRISATCSPNFAPPWGPTR